MPPWTRQRFWMCAHGRDQLGEKTFKCASGVKCWRCKWRWIKQTRKNCTDARPSGKRRRFRHSFSGLLSFASMANVSPTQAVCCNHLSQTWKSSLLLRGGNDGSFFFPLSLSLSLVADTLRHFFATITRRCRGGAAFAAPAAGRDEQPITSLSLLSPLITSLQRPSLPLKESFVPQ